MTIREKLTIMLDCIDIEKLRKRGITDSLEEIEEIKKIMIEDTCSSEFYTAETYERIKKMYTEDDIYKPKYYASYKEKLGEKDNQ